MTQARVQFCLLLSVVMMLGGGGPGNADSKKNTTIVIVYNKDGRPRNISRVRLEFTNGGFTPSELTNRDGVATFIHSGEGTVRVYVDGDHNSHRTTGKAPGTIRVYLKK